MKKSRVSVPSAAAILAGGVFFTGPATAAVIFSENFEGVNVFGMNTYTYAQNYTMPNAAGDVAYGNGGAGVNGGVSTNSFPGGNISLTGASGVSAAQIDAGLVAYDFSGQFTSWLTQGDWAELVVTFMDSSNAVIGTPVVLGGQAFTLALATGDNGRYTDAREWGTDTRTGTVPAGARSLSPVINATKVPDGTAIDGYVDNISLSVNVIPEPGTLTLAGLAGLALLRRRR
jgi:uncharacterized protein (TIGR03382 family)